jgi:malate dehydrogenase (oxaloacetate-decarboxylating)
VSGNAPHPSASFSASLRVHLDDEPGSFARLAGAIGAAGGSLGAIDLVRVEHGKKIRDVTVLASDDAHIGRIVEAVRALPGIEVEHVSDRTFLLHLHGKLEVAAKSPLKTRDDLSMAYTPGVARVSRAIADDPEKVWNLTIKQNAVAVVTDGTAVLGLGDIGPEAALPVMEGKAILFKEFGDVDAWPACLATKDPDRSSAQFTCLPRSSAASTSRTSRPPAASRSRRDCARSSTSRCFTTTSTGRRSSSSRLY